MTVPLGGVGAALVTLFDDGGGVDTAATAEHAARLVGLGLRHVVVCGSTGEAWSLTPGERVCLVQEVRDAVPASVPVIAGTGAPAAVEAVPLTAEARGAGADGGLVLSPPGAGDLAPTVTSRGIEEVTAARSAPARWCATRAEPSGPARLRRWRPAPRRGGGRPACSRGTPSRRGCRGCGPGR